MSQVMPDPAAAAVPLSPVKSPGFKRFKLGEFEVTTLLDGLRLSDGPFPTFGADQAQEKAAELMRATFLPAPEGTKGRT
ncbi:hypothetical protein KC221_26570, partial [Mycobacterium tuberculosis]|nr:hypothetical protein [Mycobacterium tuberculosis]